MIARNTNGDWLQIQVDGRSRGLKGFEPGDRIVEWTDLRSVLAFPNGSIPVFMHRIDLDTGARSKVGEIAPADRAGVLAFQVFAYRDNGAQYITGAIKRISALYLIDRK